MKIIFRILHPFSAPPCPSWLCKMQFTANNWVCIMPLFPCIIERDQAVCLEAPWKMSTPKAARPPTPGTQKKALHTCCCTQQKCNMQVAVHVSLLRSSCNVQHAAFHNGSRALFIEDQQKRTAAECMWRGKAKQSLDFRHFCRFCCF